MSQRARALVLVALAGAALAAIAVGGAVMQGRGYETQGEAHAQMEPPALELDVFAGGRAADAIRAGERAYERGDAAEASARFETALRVDPGSIEAAVGAAIAAWPDGTTDRLRELVERHPGSGVARLHLGFALAAEGEVDDARAAWREIERVDPDSSAALEVENLLHPEMPRGRPFFIPTAPSDPALDRLPVEARLAELRRRTRLGSGSRRAAAWIAYGAALQRVGRPVSARVAFDRALALAPASAEAATAAAVARFDKDDPSLAFSRLGPLVRTHGRSPVVRFHLGYLLLWLGQMDEAKRQLRLAREAGPRTARGKDAKRLLDSLER